MATEPKSPNETFTVSNCTCSLVMRGTSCNQMKQTAFVWLLESGLDHCAFHQLTLPRGGQIDGLWDERQGSEWNSVGCGGLRMLGIHPGSCRTCKSSAFCDAVITVSSCDPSLQAAVYCKICRVVCAWEHTFTSKITCMHACAHTHIHKRTRTYTHKHTCA